ncbi:unnamed protein product [Parajaminaea phylloscopi]
MLRSIVGVSSRSVAATFAAPATQLRVCTRGLRSLADLTSSIESQSSKATEQIKASAGRVSAEKSEGVFPTLSKKSAQPFRQSLVLTLSCPDTRGIVHRVTGWLASRHFDIRDSAQYGDPDTARFFMRVHANGPDARTVDIAALVDEFRRDVGEEMKMNFEIVDEDVKPKTMLMVSKIGHCIHDLLYRYSVGTLPVRIPCIVSNHSTFATLAAQHNIPFHHLPIDAEHSKEWQEEQILKLVEEHQIDLVVLARYMQILSPKLCEVMSSRIINIHHSFLPSFKGAKPYHQAHTRGVKLIGATAHLVTSALDEGPIIEQDVERVGHAYTPSELVKMGAEIETRVLARAVQWKAERRILENGGKTVVFN